MKSRDRKVIPGHGFQLRRAYRNPERVGMVCAEPECQKLARLCRLGRWHKSAAIRVTAVTMPTYSQRQAVPIADEATQFIFTFVPVYQYSEIRLVRIGNLGVCSRVPLDVFGADKFPPFVQGVPKR